MVMCCKVHMTLRLMVDGSKEAEEDMEEPG